MRISLAMIFWIVSVSVSVSDESISKIEISAGHVTSSQRASSFKPRSDIPSSTLPPATDTMFVRRSAALLTAQAVSVPARILLPQAAALPSSTRLLLRPVSLTPLFPLDLVSLTNHCLSTYFFPELFPLFVLFLAVSVTTISVHILHNVCRRSSIICL